MSRKVLKEILLFIFCQFFKLTNGNKFYLNMSFVHCDMAAKLLNLIVYTFLTIVMQNNKVKLLEKNIHLSNKFITCFELIAKIHVLIFSFENTKFFFASKTREFTHSRRFTRDM